MDKRTVTFVLAMLITMFGVNTFFSYWNPQQVVKKVEQPKEVIVKPIAQPPTDAKFYVLENNYQQLVFSTKGAALVEINLPFQSATNQNSVVKEIGFDRDILETSPENARFPLRSYQIFGKTGVEERARGNLGGYYPLLRRDLNSPSYYSLNLVSEYPEVAETSYTLKEFTATTIVFESVQAQRKVTKTYTIGSAPYCIELTIAVDGDARGLWLTTGVPESEGSGLTPALKYRSTRQNKAEVTTVNLPQETTVVSTINPDWICNSNGFLGFIIDPLTEIDAGFKAELIPATKVPSRLSLLNKKDDLTGYVMQFPLKSNGGTMRFRVYAGPFADNILKSVDKTFSDSATGYNPDYVACQSFQGIFAFISEPFAKLLLILMKFFYGLTASWAFSIILLTVALRVMLYPLNAWSLKSTMKLQQIGPQVAAIQEKYKKDPKKAQMEVITLYREAGVNPVSGCFPIIIQMPFLVGMFDLLKSTFELRGAVFIPGWINDLAAPDVLFRWDYPIFFIGNEFHLLPILLGGVMFIQQRFFSPVPRVVGEMTDQQRQQQAMGTLMTGMFAILFYNVPSGLNIYWLFSMLLGIGQQWLTQRNMVAKKVTQ